MTDPVSASPDLSRAAVLATVRRSRSPEAGGVGLRTHPFCSDNVGDPRLPRVAEEFLVASRLKRWDLQTQSSISTYSSDPLAACWAYNGAEQVPADRLTPLPPSPDIAEPLTSVVRRRRSERAFSDAPLAAAALAGLLRHGAGPTADGEVVTEDGVTLEGAFHAVPSAGGLRPVQVWVAASRVTGVPEGIHRYLPERDALAAHAGPEGLAALLDALQDAPTGPHPRQAAAMVLLVARPWRAMRKYGPRGMRFVLHECGGLAQNVHLAATGAGLATTDFSGFYDDEANAALGVDGVLEALLHTVLVGIAE
ncbi:SagB/ThcOx family dehydrogenase [Streptomyces montanisoli]|uniref:SagB/ThcOx family dehydrogenase n=1 Tax=Streptomyces montanisoli TaxID=2798581 RepID=A0A940RVZ9_9ACTN|nr:SagB/ThcOx family dehydrogenase [Streptomyces montanisoli]MBP0456593.1 SagB/ThcOx family dehydrogenase [Streptomyces montanisoli]